MTQARFPSYGHRPGVPRRRALAAAGVTILAPAALAACGPAAGLARPTAAKPRTTLVWQPWRVGWASSWTGVFQQALAPFLKAHPGVDIVIDVGDGPVSNDAAVLAAILAGAGPDVYSGFAPAKMIEAKVNLDLAPYLRRFNVDTHTFDAGQFAKFTTNGGVYALPAELSTSAVVLNLSLLDQLGIPYPAGDWDYREAASLWRRTTKASNTASGRRVGFTFWGQKAAWLPGDFYWRGWGASVAQGGYTTKCALDSHEATAFAQWWYPLMHAGVVSWLGAAPPWPQQVACGFAGSWSLPMYAQQTSVKYDFWPQPRWPTGTTAYAGNDYYAVSRTTHQPELAASFAIWLATSKDWADSLTRMQLVLPPTRGSWEQWQAVVRAVAPPLAHKNLGAFTVAAMADRAFNHPAFAYLSDAAYGRIAPYTTRMAMRQISVPLGLQEATRAVDTFEIAAQSTTLQTARVQAELKRAAASTHAVTFQPAPRAGLGVPASVPPKGSITHHATQWTMIGDGGDVWATSDNCTYACIPWTSSDGSFVARVAAIRNVDCPHLSQWSKVGLMARGDLSDDAAMVLVCASGDHGVFVDSRQVPGTSASQQGPLSPAPKTGLIGAQYLTKPNTAKHHNYLLRPVWLRLVRAADSWQPASSFDGKTWTKAGAALRPGMAGCWVGIFCASHNSSFGGKGRIAATFDRLSFTPSTQVQLGTPGKP